MQSSWVLAVCSGLMLGYMLVSMCLCYNIETEKKKEETREIEGLDMWVRGSLCDCDAEPWGFLL